MEGFRMVVGQADGDDGGRGRRGLRLFFPLGLPCRSLDMVEFDCGGHANASQEGQFKTPVVPTISDTGELFRRLETLGRTRGD
jgi:hypothetical protein